MILAEGDAGRQDHDGNDLRYFDVLVESQILVESVQPVNAGQLKELSKNRGPAAIEEVIGIMGAGGGIGTAAGKGGAAAKIFWAIVSELFYDALTDMPPSDNTKTWAEYCRENPENPFCKGIS